MYCNTIYDNDWKKKLLSADPDGLSKKFNEYQISTGVGKCCMDRYNQELSEIDKIKIEPYKGNQGEKQ